MKTTGYAAHSSGAHLVPYDFERRNLQPNDVMIEILFSGCHHLLIATPTGLSDGGLVDSKYRKTDFYEAPLRSKERRKLSEE